MPKITKQSARGERAAVNGSVLSQAIPVSELEDDYVKIVIYGQNRTGKTALSCEFPKPLLLIACEPTKTGGAKTVKKVSGVEFIRITSTQQALKLAEELKDDTTFKTHVIDSATSYQDIVLKEILDLEAVPEQLNWGTVSRDQYRERSEKTRECLRPFLELPAHTVVLAKERDHNPPDKDKPKILRGSQLESFFASDLGGATVGWLHDACDYLVRLYIDKETRVVKKLKGIGKGQVEVEEEEETGRMVRRLRTMYHCNFAAGMRSADPDAVPEYIEAVTPKEMYDALMKVIGGERVKQGKYNT